RPTLLKKNKELPAKINRKFFICASYFYGVVIAFREVCTFLLRTHAMTIAAISVNPKYPITGYTVPTNVTKPTKLEAKAMAPKAPTDTLNFLLSGLTIRAVNAYSMPTAVL